MNSRNVLPIALALGLTVAILVRSSLRETTPSAKSTPIPPTQITKSGFVSFEEIYRNTPIHSTDQGDWRQLKKQHEGEHVKGRGRVDSVSIHSQEGKLFLIVTLFGKEGVIETSATQIALLIEDVRTIAGLDHCFGHLRTRIGRINGSRASSSHIWGQSRLLPGYMAKTMIKAWLTTRASDRATARTNPSLELALWGSGWQG